MFNDIISLETIVMLDSEPNQWDDIIYFERFQFRVAEGVAKRSPRLLEIENVRNK